MMTRALIKQRQTGRQAILGINSKCPHSLSHRSFKNKRASVSHFLPSPRSRSRTWVMKTPLDVVLKMTGVKVVGVSWECYFPHVCRCFPS